MSFSIDIDTGGTFTDGFFLSGDQSASVKVPTTPHDLTECFLKCIEAGADCFKLSVEDLLYQTQVIRFSNTIGTNTIIQRDGAKVGLLVSQGQGSLAPCQEADGKPPLVVQDMVREIRGETGPDGQVISQPEAEEVLAQAQELIDAGARCLVLALKGSDRNASNERLARGFIKELYPRDYLGSVPVFLSSDISQRGGEAQRINAAVLNAYIHAKLVRLLYKAGEELRQRLYSKNLFIVHNNGAVARVAKTRAINTYNSGPAAGLLGARLIGRLYGADDLISADMGGTSFDLGYVRGGQPSYTLQPDVEGFPVNVPMLSIRAIGAGGGSIASVNGKGLQVGPQSAGALPGPVCFDLGGGEPTVTDADLVLGLLDPDYFLGGTMKLNAAKAREVLTQKVADPLGVSPEEAALAIKQDIDRAMAEELAKIKKEMGPDFDPLLVVYGGAGPAHICDIASAAGLKKIVMTPFSAVFSAFSSLSMDVGHLYYRRVGSALDDQGLVEALENAVEAMKSEAQRDMRGEGFSPEEITYTLELLVQPADGGPEVKVAAPEGLAGDAKAMEGVQAEAVDLLATQGWTGQGPLKLNTISLLAQAAVPHYDFPQTPPAPGDAGQALRGERRVFAQKGGEGALVPVYDRTRLGNGHAVQGPALVESEHTTVYLPNGWGMKVDQYNNLLLEEA
ncbi:MAG: hydantoinase/oxoprolinase family protein [Desulfarculaceae bacterium]|nr:hydantoinase/oxoprolinase family protein [Desulfarculaceae bacterium]MCF8047915.1 hydantoinase/oxoprolinase family protein [Desulfarculaceae bacterium]MCF8099638.1 hydantoinase/oxoprolinase family protein [Desulfarculaceae bacterium]MCF8122365.1 hydantoinase/oxoprolinase family protein [Desulfarculaceae bacterium]